jgi:hypothetical protein
MELCVYPGFERRAGEPGPQDLARLMRESPGELRAVTADTEASRRGRGVPKD